MLASRSLYGAILVRHNPPSDADSGMLRAVRRIVGRGHGPIGQNI
jgi:hypothetical protein